MLNSKITIPHLSRTFQRPRLQVLLQQLTRKRLTLVVGGAGYGKTTLIANTIKHQKIQAVWYNLDETDRDFSIFIAYLLHGFKPYLKGMDEIRAALQSAPRLSAPQRLEILEKLIHQLEKKIDFALILVLDDFHLVQNKPEICESIEFMLKHMPTFIHLVLLSRSEPAIRISRLRVMDDVTEVNESDMTFTLEEIEGLSSDMFNLRLGSASLKQIKAKTNGWAASLILCFLVLRDKPDAEIEKQLDGITGSHKLFFTYLEENVFESQSPVIKQFMLNTALLDKLDPDFCDTYLEINRSKALLEQLTADHLLTSKNESGGLYAYHHLLKEFLRSKLLKETDDKNISEQYLKIARLLESRGEDIAAIKYYLKGKHFLSAAQRLLDAEEELFHAGQINRIRDFLNQFPETMIENGPGLAYINAKICSLSGNQQGAIDLFNRALKGFRKEKSEQRVVDCQIHLGLNYYYTGHIKKAETYLENCMKTGGGMRTLEIAGLLIMIPAILGDSNKADAYVNMAHKVLAGLEGPVKRKMEAWIRFCASYRFFCSGDFRRAYDLGLDAFKRFQGDHATAIMPLACLHVALPAYFTGQPETGLDYARKGLQHLEQMDIHDNQVGWLNYGLALNLGGLGRPDEALAHARQSLDLFARQSCYWGQATACDLMHFIHRRMENLDEAHRELVNGLKILEIADLPFTRAVLEIGRLSLLIDKGRFNGARRLLEAVKDKVGSSFFYTFKVHLLASRLEWHSGRHSYALGHLRAAFGMAVEHGYERQFADHGGWINSLLEVLPADEIDRTWVQRLLEVQKEQSGRVASADRQRQAMMKPVPAVMKPAGRQSASGIRISLLGHFRIKIDGRYRSPDDLKNAKALMMIKYLAAMHNNGFIHRDEIIELLWPEQDFNRTRKRFNVAVSAIRKFFEPQIKRGQPSAYLKKQGVSFKLDPGSGGGIDVHEFMEQIRLGNRCNDPARAFHYYMAAQTLYAGPFLIEDPYTQWCCDERRNLQHQYLSMLWKIICYFAETKDHARGIFYADQYLGVDDSAEHVYQKLMHFHALAGNRSEIKKVFERCKRIVSDSLDCPLHPQTIDLYHSLLR